MIRMRSFAAAALAAAFVLSVPTASHAQLGGALKRAAKKKAEDALKGKPEQPADTAAPAATPAADAGRRGRAAENFGSTSATPKFDATTIEITAPVVDRFLAGMAAEQKARQAFAKDQAKGAEYEATIDKYERCVQKKMEERNAEGTEQHVGLYMNYWQAVMRGDTTTTRVLGDSLAKLGFASPEAACGKRPVEAYMARSRLENESSEVEGAGADAGNFSIRQYSVMKERIYPFVEAENRKQPLKGGYTDAEMAAMRAKLPELTAAFKAADAKR